jgi:hypothetical protein
MDDALSLTVCVFCFTPHGMKLDPARIHHHDRRPPADDVPPEPREVRAELHPVRDVPA